MAGTLIDVTDLVEFLQREESVSGVQRVIAETAPKMLQANREARAVLLDRNRGVFVELTGREADTLLPTTASVSARTRVASEASSCLARAAGAEQVKFDDRTVLVFLGAVWINDALMMAARVAHAAGTRCVYLLYDLTPVLQTGHTAAVNRLFDRYLHLITQTASAVPAISASSRADYVRYCEDRRQPAPPGDVTGLPCGITPDQFDTAASPWPRPYALFVGTVEARKNHLLALHAWRRLIDTHGPQAIPDLVCVGRLGWHADEFLSEYVESGGLSGKVSVLSTSVTDEDLARFYAHAEFTVYPSNYEGWGLPVSESLAFGKLPIVADNSSLPEAGRDLAAYFTTDDLDSLVDCLERHAIDPAARAAHEARITGSGPDPHSWQRVADILAAAVTQVSRMEGRKPVIPTIELGREYVVASLQAPPDGGHADRYLAYLKDSGLTPMLRQPRRDDDFETVDAALLGGFGSPQTWGFEIRPGRRAVFSVTRPVDGDLLVLFATRSMPGVVTMEAVGPGGPAMQDVYLGSVLTLALGAGIAGDPAQVSLSVIDAHDSIEGFLGVRSFVLLRADDLQAQVIAHKSTADALRQELDFITGTRSWKVTAPLRRFKGRSSGR